MSEPSEEALRSALRAAILARGFEAVIKEVEGVAGNTVRNFVAGNRETSRRTLDAVRAWQRRRQAAEAEATVAAPAPRNAPTVVREAQTVPYGATGELRGRIIEVEALMAYALERQRLLLQSVPPEALSPSATPEALEAATRRQHAADAAAAAARAREA